VGEVGNFYRAEGQPVGTHLALRWKGRLRFIVPRNAAAQKVFWKVFHPGWQKLPLRAMARLTGLFTSVSCFEADALATIRGMIGTEAGISGCNIGAPGPWSKDTILFLDKKTSAPLLIVKAGFGKSVGSLLRNESDWLRTLQDQASLAGHIPKLVAHRSGADLSFVAESPLQGKIEPHFGESHIVFLRKLQDYSRRTMRLEESRLYRNLHSRITDLQGQLTQEWSTRLDAGMRCIEHSLSASPLVFAAAHNDFTPWNLRVERGLARVFDWEYADYEQLPLFDPLHFALLPMALKRRPAHQMVRRMNETIQHGPLWLGKESCSAPQTQALAYLMNLCTLYLWSEGGKSDNSPVLESYAPMIDHLDRS